MKTPIHQVEIERGEPVTSLGVSSKAALTSSSVNLTTLSRSRQRQPISTTNLTAACQAASARLSSVLIQFEGSVGHFRSNSFASSDIFLKRVTSHSLAVIMGPFRIRSAISTRLNMFPT